MTIPRLQDSNGYIRNDLKEVSPIETLDFATVLVVLTQNINDQGILDNMRILSPYQRQYDFACTSLRESYSLMD